jgi:hypothetical protein
MVEEIAVAESLSAFKVYTDQGVTYVLPRSPEQRKGRTTCVLENSEVMKLMAMGHKVKNVRYIDDSVRPVLLVEVG